MSWGEIKKINSDLSMPLDERMSYISGIIPRGVEKKSITGNVGVSVSVDGQNITASDSKEVVVLEIDGSGMISSIIVKIPKSNSNYANIRQHSATISVYCDGKEAFSATRETDATIFALDINQMYKEGESTNVPILFKKKLIIKAEVSITASVTLTPNYSGNASVDCRPQITYAIFSQ